MLVPDKNALKRELDSRDLSFHSKEGQNAAIQLFVEVLKTYGKAPRLKSQFPGKWIPSTFAILGESFTEANGFLYSTLKLVRWRIVQHYKDRIDYLDTAEGKDPFNAQNMTIIDRLVD